MHFFQVRCKKFIEGARSTEVNVPKLHSHRSHRSKVPNDQLPVDSGCVDPGDCLALPFVGSHVRDRALVDRKQAGFSLRAPTSTIGARETPRIRILERVRGRAIQFPGPNRDKSGRSENRFRSGRAVEIPDEPPSTFVPIEDVRPTIMASSDSGSSEVQTGVTRGSVVIQAVRAAGSDPGYTTPMVLS